LSWEIKYTESALRQLKKLDKPIARKVLDFMDERIAPLADPRSSGKNLVGPKMGSYWRYRIGNVRVICDIKDSELVVLVIELGHRKEIYG
jgi:mRNA interferase RelE/StbE